MHLALSAFEKRASGAARRPGAADPCFSTTVSRKDAKPQSTAESTILSLLSPESETESSRQTQGRIREGGTRLPKTYFAATSGLEAVMG